ncbi:MAG: hypothetical protein IH899_06845, partial [Planctomycetes bacterium]|nr:hypothetical protein [Planctomycetota bacterium]
MHPSRQEIVVLTGHTDWVRDVAFSPDSSMLVSASRDHSIILWDLQSHEAKTVIPAHRGSVESVAFSPDGKLLAAAGYHHPDFDFVGFLSLRDMKSGKAVFEQEVAGRATAIAFSHNGKTFAVAAGLGSRGPFRGKKPVISLWDTASRKQVATLEGHEGAVRWMTFSPDGKTLTSVGERMAIRRWNVEQGKLLS